jgi:membrane protein DedA with SNARE-associated domain
MLEALPHWLEQIDPLVAYIILMISAFVENVFPPIPGDTVTVIGAYLVSTGRLGFWGVYVSTTVGSVIGFFTMYLLGLKLGSRLLKTRWINKAFNPQRIEKVGIGLRGMDIG